MPCVESSWWTGYVQFPPEPLQLSLLHPCILTDAELPVLLHHPPLPIGVRHLLIGGVVHVVIIVALVVFSVDELCNVTDRHFVEFLVREPLPVLRIIRLEVLTDVPILGVSFNLLLLNFI